MNEKSLIDPIRLQTWEAKYREDTTGWDRGSSSPALAHWLQRMPQGRILVPGCGHGHEISELVRSGRFVTAIDIAPTPVMRLTARLHEEGLHATVIQADLLNWEPEQPFDAIYEQTCLCALDPGHWAEYESRLARWLRPGGRLHALFMQTGREGGPPFHCALPRMHELFDTARWQWPQEPGIEVPHPNGLKELGFVLERR
ncbi:MAG: thiopurine S-methyltransferase [Gammaproteobacteria bacterium RIFOXYA12_FULL_61_12]|nr:MAG: thiopurine S-methyltransferase [Gammaproteobacteria bacterium RIFOXYD12_FULL_61_37]OGT91239.1 MAG: thiopurine S-methyltransferase [Gammaproteobacteria bacterium RIFOXYA12_FULL_61_12]